MAAEVSPHRKEHFDPSVLQGLESSNHLELLNIIDNLRHEGLGEHVGLPQLIVCGDQSSGKSSVLAAISGVPFPKKDNLCTRFATEVILRRENTLGVIQIAVSIMPGGSRSPASRKKLDAFKRELGSIDELPSIINEATKAMGLGNVSGAFSSDTLRLEVRGPNLPQLTIVDLPGLIHSENKHQTQEAVRLVTQLVEEYMKQERSIVLAIVSAKYDHANQIILAKARDVDAKGRRTLGIITKPDTLHPGSGSEGAYLALAKNQDVHFSLGWHVVRNLDQNEPATPRAKNRNVDFSEKMLRAVPVYPLGDNARGGTPSLRVRAAELIRSHRGKELPGTFNPSLVGQLSREMSSSWSGDASRHAESLWSQARGTVTTILNKIAEQSVSDACMKLVIDPQLEKMREDLRKRLDDYMQEFRRQSITYNHYLTEIFQDVRSKRVRQEAVRRLNDLFRTHPQLTSTSCDLIIDTIAESKVVNMNEVAAKHLGDYTEAYYKVALKRLIDEVPAHVIEHAIMVPLPSLLDPVKVLTMSENTIDAIAGEPQSRVKRREALQAKLDVLTRSSVICRSYTDRDDDTGTSHLITPPSAPRKRDHDPDVPSSFASVQVTPDVSHVSRLGSAGMWPKGQRPSGTYRTSDHLMDADYSST